MEQATTVQDQVAVGPAMVLVGVVDVMALEGSELTGASKPHVMLESQEK